MLYNVKVLLTTSIISVFQTYICYWFTDFDQFFMHISIQGILFVKTIF
nr:MAG TPA: hypothetical protein [Caudoviricetes sp.]